MNELVGPWRLRFAMKTGACGTGSRSTFKVRPTCFATESLIRGFNQYCETGFTLRRLVVVEYRVTA